MTEVPTMDEVLRSAPKKLAAHCAEDRQYTFLYTAAPLKVNQASGSPVNPLVIK